MAFGRQSARICVRSCQFDEAYRLYDEASVQRLADLECEIIEGSLTLGLQESIAQDTMDGLNTIREITDSLSIIGSAKLEVFRGLERVGCTLYVSSNADLSLDALKSVGVGLEVNESFGIRSVSFPALSVIGDGDYSKCSQDGGYLYAGLLVFITRELIQVDMPELREVTGKVLFSDNPDLEAICLPSLEQVTPRQSTDDPDLNLAFPFDILCVSDAFAEDHSLANACPTAERCLDSE